MSFIKAVMVDDEKFFIKNVDKIFNWEKYDFKLVFRTTDPYEVCEYVRENEVDVIFTDVIMPQISGFELIDKVRADSANEKTEFVILSSYSDYTYMRNAIHCNVLDYCQKPIGKTHADDLLQRLRKNFTISEAYLSEKEKNDEKAIFNKQFKMLIEYINNNFSQKLLLKDLAKKFYFNANYLCALFKKNFGMSFSSYVKDIRMKHAKDLLENYNFSVYEVSKLAGYSDYSYFHKVYTEYWGTTPAQSRKSN